MTFPSHLTSRTDVRVADYPPSATYGPRRLPDHEFVWVLRGSATWELEEEHPERGTLRHERLLRPGTLALARAGAVDSYRWSPDGSSTHAYVHFSLAPTAGAPAPHEWPLTRPMHPDGPLAGLCTHLLDTAGDDDPATRARGQRVLDLLWELFVHGPVPGSSATAPAASPIACALAAVRRSWDVDGVRLVGVAELAAAAGVSAAHFSRSFSRAHGFGPATALELVRLARAATALERSNLPLAEVARCTGFSNQYHFSRRFAEAYGRPPGSYRRAAGELDPLAPVRARGLLPLWQVLGPRDPRG